MLAPPVPMCYGLSMAPTGSSHAGTSHSPVGRAETVPFPIFWGRMRLLVCSSPNPWFAPNRCWGVRPAGGGPGPGAPWVGCGWLGEGRPMGADPGGSSSLKSDPVGGDGLGAGTALGVP